MLVLLLRQVWFNHGSIVGHQLLGPPITGHLGAGRVVYLIRDVQAKRKTLVFRLIDRYIFREVTQVFIVVTGVLLVMLLSNQIASVLGRAAEGHLPRDAVLPLLGYTSIQYLTVLIPVALFLAMMLALARLYRDSEMVAMYACGRGQARIYRPLMLLAIPVALLLAWFSLEVTPWSVRQIEILKSTARRDVAFGELEPGRFKTVGSGDTVFYSEALGENKELKNIFMRRRDGDLIQIVVAESARQVDDPDSGDTSLVFFNGSRFEGEPGSVEFRITEFSEHGVPIHLPDPELDEVETAALSTRDLNIVTDLAHRAELEWRLSIPLMTLFLTLLAVPLSKTNPREGRYNRLAIAIIFYMVYSNLLGAGRIWVEQGALPPWLGVNWVHGVFLLCAMTLLMRQNSTFARVFGNRRNGAGSDA
jgi:lipopolysaccharide export system permease protein